MLGAEDSTETEPASISSGPRKSLRPGSPRLFRSIRTRCTRASRSISFTASPSIARRCAGRSAGARLAISLSMAFRSTCAAAGGLLRSRPATRTPSNSIRSAPWAWRPSFPSPITTTLRLPCRCRRWRRPATSRSRWSGRFLSGILSSIWECTIFLRVAPARSMDRLKAFTERPLESDLRAILAGLHAEPGTLTVFNHPLWDETGIGTEQHRTAAVALLSQYGEYLHAIELNGLRPWQRKLIRHPSGARLGEAGDFGRRPSRDRAERNLEPHERGQLCRIRRRDSRRLERRAPGVALPDSVRHASLPQHTRRLSDLRKSSAGLDGLVRSRLLHPARWNHCFALADVGKPSSAFGGSVCRIHAFRRPAIHAICPARGGLRRRERSSVTVLDKAMPSDLLERPALAGSESLLDRMLLLGELKQLCHSAAEQSEGNSFFDTLLRRLDLSYVCAETDRRRIPAEVPSWWWPIILTASRTG